MTTLLTDVDNATRREFLALLGAAGLLTGCAADAPDDGPRDGTPGYPRTVTHLGGSLELAAPPQRIAVTGNRYLLDELLLLDVVPVGYAASDSEELPAWTRAELERRGAAVANYHGRAYAAGPDHERLAALSPDLIVAYDLDTAEDLATLQRIAPVVQLAYTDLDGSRLRMLAAILGREDRVAAIEAGVAAELARVTPPAGEVAIVFGYRDGGAAAQAYNGGGRSELVILERAGFRLADYGRPAGERDFTISEENFALLDRDLLWNVAPYPGDTSAADFAASPVLQNLDVVREGRYRSLTADQSQAILFWTPLAVPFLVDTLNALVASYGGTA